MVMEKQIPAIAAWNHFTESSAKIHPNSIRQLTPNPPPKPSINKLTNKNLAMQALCGHLQNFNLSLSLERSALSREGTLSLPWAQEGTKTQKQLQLPYKPKVLYPLDIFTTDIM